MTNEVRIGVIGAGFMGQTHVAAIEAARAAGIPCRLVCLCDSNPARLGDLGSAGANLRAAQTAASLDTSSVNVVSSPAEALADPEIRLVSICTPTDTHVELALAALSAGKNILLEKPVALNSAACQRLLEAEAKSPGFCAPAMCMRYWPGWDWLRQRVIDGQFGELRSASFQRLGSAPSWSSEFYANPDRSGGALTDLHVHDADLVAWLFGPPSEISSAGDLHHVTTVYRYETGPRSVLAEGGWLRGAALPFRMRYVAEFEHATAEYDSLRSPAFSVASEGRLESPPLENQTGYDGEMRAAVEAVLTGNRGVLRATLADALLVTRMLEAERESLTLGRPVRFS